jgi:AraC-like DNA-binding protein
VKYESQVREDWRSNVPDLRCLDASHPLARAKRPRATARFPARPERDSTSSLTGLLANFRGELVELERLLRESACTAAIRGDDGTVIPVIVRDCPEAAGGVENQGSLAAPIYDADGSTMAFLEVTPRDAGHSILTHRMLRHIVESATRAMAERWFRITHLDKWIVAAQRVGDPERSILLAVNRDYQLVAADRGTRQFLEARDMHLGSRLTLSMLFRSLPADIYEGRHQELSLRLQSVADGAPWFVLITAPDLAESQLDYGNRVLLHSRPRIGTIISLNDSVGHSREAAALSSRAIRLIEEFIDSRLEHGVNIAELATRVGLSHSHFFRVFRKSFGISPHRYLMRRRLSLAQTLLTKTDISLTDIALQAGFADQSHFSRSFQQFMGLSPGAFRKRHG